MAVRTMVHGPVQAMLESRQATKADERAHAEQWLAAHPGCVGMELHNATADDTQAMLRQLHLVHVDLHRRPDGGVELIGLSLRDPARPMACPMPLNCGAKLIEEAG